MDIMHPANVHGVGVISKLYFAIFTAFEESVTLNLAKFMALNLAIQGHRLRYRSKRVHIFLLVVNSNVDPILHRVRDTAA